MKPASTPETLRLILTHIRGVREFVDGASFQEFSTAYVPQMAVDGAVLAIARALQQLPPELPGRHSQVGWQEFGASAQMVTDGRIDTATRWRLATRDIPALEAPVVAMLSSVLETGSLVTGRAHVSAG